MDEEKRDNQTEHEEEEIFGHHGKSLSLEELDEVAAEIRFR